MVIVHVVEPFAGGVAVFVKSLTEAITDVTHIIIHGERKEEISAEEVKKLFSSPNVKFIRWKSAQRSIHPLKDTRALVELYRILKNLKTLGYIDAVHLHSSKSGLIGRIACRLAGVTRVFYTPNGAPFLAGRNYIINHIYKLFEKLGNHIGGNVVCCSASEYLEYRKLGINATYINNGISLPSVSVPVIPEKRPNTFRIITSGRIVRQKNPILFNAIASYFEEFNQFEFIWAGDGPEKTELKAKNITITGWLETEQVKTIVSQADVYLSTSVYEGLSFGVLEALALKKTVLLSDCVGNKDVVKLGLNGDIFKNKEDAILKLLSYNNNRDMIDVMGNHSHDLCYLNFDMHQNFANYRTLYAGSMYEKQNTPEGYIV